MTVHATNRILKSTIYLVNERLPNQKHLKINFFYLGIKVSLTEYIILSLFRSLKKQKPTKTLLTLTIEHDSLTLFHGL